MKRNGLIVIGIAALLIIALVGAVPGQAAPAAAVDDQYTVSLLHFNGADGSTTFTDESGKTWTAYGDAQIDTAQSVFGGASGLFDGTGDYITTADSPDWQLDGGSSSGPWAIDFRVRFNVAPNDLVPLVGQYQDNGNWWLLSHSSENRMSLWVVVGGVTYFEAYGNFYWTPSPDIWYAIAVHKKANSQYEFFIDGVYKGATAYSETIPDFSGPLYVGGFPIGIWPTLNGWMDELRISKGTDRGWTSGGYTPPTEEYSPPDYDATNTAAANQTATASAATATYWSNETATASAVTATYWANQTATANDATATYWANATGTAAWLTANPPTNTPTFTPTNTATLTATATLIGTIGPALKPSEMSYGDIAILDGWACLLMICGLLVIGWLLTSLSTRKGSNQ